MEAAMTMRDVAKRLASAIPHGNLNEIKTIISESYRSLSPSKLSEALVTIKLDHSEKNVLHIAASRGTVAILKYLMKLSVEKDAITATDKYGFTVLHRAAYEGGQPKVAYLCGIEGIDVNKKSDGGWTPLDRAVFFGKLDCVRYLTETAKANIYCRGSRGYTPMHTAVEKRHGEIVEYFCTKGYDLNVKNDDGQLPLELAIEIGNFSSAWLLVFKTTEFDFNRKFSNGNTLLHIAITEKNLEVFKYLSSLTDIKFLENDENDTPFDLAIKEIPSNLTWLIPMAYKYKQWNIVATLLMRPDVDLDEKMETGWFSMIREMIVALRKKLDHESDTENKEVLDDLLHTFLSDSNDKTQKDFSEMLVDIFERSNILNRLQRSINDVKTSEEVKSVSVAFRNIVTVGLAKYMAHKKLRYVFLKPAIRGTLVKTFLDKPIEAGDVNHGDMIRTLNLVFTSFQADNDCETTEKDFAQDALLKFELRHALESIFEEPLIHRIGFLKDIAENSLNGIDSRENTGAAKVLIQHVLDRLDEGDENLLYNEGIESFKKTIKRIDEQPEYFEKFKKKLIQLKTGESCDEELSDLQLVASKVFKAYFSDKKVHCCTALQELHERLEDKFYSKCHLYHRCVARGCFAWLPCFYRIGIHVSDVVTDILVGIEIIKEYSTRLGGFILCLAVVTLFHENFRSVNSQNELEKEVLRVKWGVYDIDEKRFWKESNLKYYHGRCSWLGRFFWPFKISRGRGTLQNFRAGIFNVFSWLMFRPVVDRLRVLTHSPTNLSTVYRQQSNERSLKQYYMVLEQMPELLIQFYVFQIFFNNIKQDSKISPSLCSTNGTSHSFNYSGKAPNSTYFNPSSNWLGIDAPLVLIYSMIVPFFMIPKGMVRLEKMFRKLCPYTPDMSTVSSNLLYLTYLMMIPSRLFLYSAMLHVVRPDHFILYAYISVMTTFWFVYNFISVKSAWKSTSEWTLFHRKNPTEKVLKLLSLLLFSFRDIFAISLRDPIAYISSPSTVTHSTLRRWDNMVVISSLYFIEGIVGAVCIQEFYPCGRNSDIFKYQGWLWLFLNIISACTIILLSYTLQPRLQAILPKAFMKKCVSISRFLFTTISFSAVIFGVKDFHIKVALISILAASVLIYVMACIFMMYLGEAKKKKTLKDQEDVENTSSHSCCNQCSLFSCSPFGQCAADEGENIEFKKISGLETSQELNGQANGQETSEELNGERYHQAGNSLRTEFSIKVNVEGTVEAEGASQDRNVTLELEVATEACLKVGRAGENNNGEAANTDVTDATPLLEKAEADDYVLDEDSLNVI